jgi:hypothetical protein
VVTEIISQHSEESSLLWLLRDSAVYEPHYKLSDLAKLDDRVEAHIDGLRIAGDEAWKICKEALAWEEAGELFTASVLAFESSVGWVEGRNPTNGITPTDKMGNVNFKLPYM